MLYTQIARKTLNQSKLIGARKKHMNSKAALNHQTLAPLKGNGKDLHH